MILRARLGGPLPGTGSRYPYFFLDMDALGVGAVLLNALGLMLGFLALGYAFWAVDEVLGKQRRP